MRLKPCIMAASLLSLSLTAEELSLPISNLSCQIERHENYDTNDGHLNEIIYWVYAVYGYHDPVLNRISAYKQFLGGESFLPGREDDETVVSHCQIVDDIRADASLNGEFVRVTSETEVSERRYQEVEGGAWAPRPSCRYTIYTVTETRLTFPRDLTLKNREYTSQTYDDECQH